MKLGPVTDLRIATYKLAKKRRQAAKDSAAITGENYPAAVSRQLLNPGKPDLSAGAPTFSGTMIVQVAPGVHWTAPAGSRVMQPKNGEMRGAYVLNGLTGHLHLLRMNEHKAVEEVQLPDSVLPELRKLFGLT